jgi:methionyl-tRNA formyltransferase
LRIVFFGTPAFAVPTLERLFTSRHQVVGVVTQPDRPRGRGQKLQPEAVKRAALPHGVPILQPERLKDAGFLANLRDLRPDIGVVAAYGKILPREILDLPARGLINVHASLLPRWRGAAPIHRAILAGDTETGVTIMRVVHALDAGAMLAAAAVTIGADETTGELESRLATLGSDLLVQVADDFERHDADGLEQDASLVTYAHRITRVDAMLDWARPAAALHDQVRALNPWPLVAVRWRDRRLMLRRTRVVAHERVATPGDVVSVSADEIAVATGQGALGIREVQLEGRPPVAVPAFLAGHRVAPGDRLDPWPAAGS